MKVLNKLAVAFSTLAIISTLTLTTSFACTNGNKWYEDVRWNSAPQNQAVYTKMGVSNGAVTDSSQGGFIAQVMWEATNNQNDASINWVEAGYTYGWNAQNILTYYFADGRPCGSWGCNKGSYDYHEHKITSITPSVGSTMPIELVYAGGNSWDVLFNGNIQTASNANGSISTNNPPYSRGMACGIENTNANNYLIGSSCGGLTYWDLLGNAHNWGGSNPSSGTSATFENYCGGNVYWLNAGSDLATDFG